MENEELLLEYSNSIRRLKKQCTEAGITDEEFKKLYTEIVLSKESPRNAENRSSNRFKSYATVAMLVMFTLIVIYNSKSLYNYLPCLSCNLQEYIYPGLRLLRKLSIPIISLFPSLTALYHETCLIQNPFFTVVDMDCWPCSTINGIIEIYDPKPVTEQQSPPFFYKTDQKSIGIDVLKKLYLSNKEIFEREAPNVLGEAKSYIHPNKMFAQHQSGKKQFYIWKFNNMNEAKVLRQIISRPKVVPKFGQSTERFIIVDTSQLSIRMPDTECSFSFLLPLSGSRTIHLVPAEECKHQCKTLKVNLKETHLLWYNWWYWRPVIQPSNGNETFIAHIGSYC